jgi:hypothetical protein
MENHCKEARVNKQQSSAHGEIVDYGSSTLAALA